MNLLHDCYKHGLLPIDVEFDSVEQCFRITLIKSSDINEAS